MLNHIHIENFALIDALDLDLTTGLTTITGETGAGKSILLGALGLVMGNRADLSAVRDTTRKCIVEVQLDLNGLELESVFESLDLDYENLTIIRREILPSGKSRAFVNDSPVTLQALTAIRGFLIDIHSQHQTLHLSDEFYQVTVLDSYISESTKDIDRPAKTIIKEYSEQLINYKSLTKELKVAQAKEASLAQEFEYNNFLLEELEAVNLDTLDIAALEEESVELSNVETISLAFEESTAMFTLEESGILEQLRYIQKKMSQLAQLSSQYTDLKERTSSVLLELEDVVASIERQADHVEANPERLEYVDNRIAALENLLRKHNKVDTTDLIAYRDELAVKVLDTKGLSTKIKSLKASLELATSQLESLSRELTALRIKLAPSFGQEILDTIKALGMPDAHFKVAINKSDTFLPTGRDVITFTFTANKGTDLLALDKAASGGELSRVMLAIKALMSRCKKLPTIIFDEIDTGVSGTIASKMSQIMLQMAQTMQVITITHLPQIAAAGNAHLFVKKAVVGDRTVSQIQLLTKEDRVEELAQMLSAGSISTAARENARELLK